MRDLKGVDEVLNYHIRPRTYPIAIRMCTAGEKIPQGAIIPSEDLGLKIHTCEGIAMVRYHGLTVAINKQNESCGFGALFLGFVPFKGEFLEGNIEFPPCTTKELRARVVQDMKANSLEYGKYEYILLAPLRKATFEPNLVVVYGNSAQVGRLVQSTVHETGEPLVSHFRGSGSCSNIIGRTMLGDKCTFVLPGMTELRTSGAMDYEVIFTMPLSRIESTLRGLEATHKMGYRYPLPPYLRMRDEIPEMQKYHEQFKKAMDYLWESE